MTDEHAWRPGVNGAGRRPWFLIRGESFPILERYHLNRSGNLVRYATYETASAAALRKNRAG